MLSIIHKIIKDQCIVSNKVGRTHYCPILLVQKTNIITLDTFIEIFLKYRFYTQQCEVLPRLLLPNVNVMQAVGSII